LAWPPSLGAGDVVVACSAAADEEPEAPEPFEALSAPAAAGPASCELALLELGGAAPITEPRPSSLVPEEPAAPEASPRSSEAGALATPDW